MFTEVLTGPSTFQSLPPTNLKTCSKRDIEEYFLNSYSLYESIFLGLKDETVFLARPNRLRLPLIFYYGHTASVYINKLVLVGLIKPEERVNQHLETLLETGVDENSWDDTENYRMGGKFTWPRLSEVVNYRSKVKAAILKVIEDTPLKLPITKESPWWAVVMGIEHERMHLETSSVLIRQLPVDMVTVPEGWVHGPTMHDVGVKRNDLITVDEMTVTLGKPEEDTYYGWDNEYGSKTLRVPRFEASRYLVTNAEFLDFVDDGGYGRREFWSDEGWQWKTFREARHPTFWVCSKGCKSGFGGDLAEYTHCKPMTHLLNGNTGDCNGHGTVEGHGQQGLDTYRLRGVFSELAMPWDWPVEVNYHEAKAFCRWKGDHFRLATEAEHAAMGDMPTAVTEWHRFLGRLRWAQQPSVGRVRFFCSLAGCKAPGTHEDSHNYDNDVTRGTEISANNNINYGSSTPVNMFPPSRRGFHDLQGNVWEWLEDHFNMFPAADTDFLYNDYSTSSCDGRHGMMVGGSWATTGVEMSPYTRFAFRRHFFQHSGFRLVRSLPENKQGRIYIPVKLVSTPLYIEGAGMQGAPDPPMDATRYTFEYEPSTNKQMALETAGSLNIALAEEFGNGREFQILLANRCEAVIEQFRVTKGKALHLGCGTGCLTTLIAHQFDKTFATDSVGRFIDTCQTFKQGRGACFTEDGKEKTARFDNDISCRNITFKQLTWLPQEVERSDFILVTNLYKYNNEKAWLVRMPELVLPGGLLAIVCTESWRPNDLMELYKDRLTLVQQEDLLNTTSRDSPFPLTFWRHM